MQSRVDRLKQAREAALKGGGADKIARQHERGKLTARERLNALLDPGSFSEIGMLATHLKDTPGDGIITGHGTIDGKIVCVFAQDATVAGIVDGIKGYISGLK